MKRIAGLLYGVTCYALFLGTFSYAVGFVGNVFVPRSVDSGPSSSPWAAALVDALLLSVFAIQHSVMARQGFKQRWTRIIPRHIERSTYVLAATLALALVLWQWRPIPRVLWDLRGTPVASVLGVLFWVGWGILLLSTFLLNHFELFGLQQTWTHLWGDEADRQPTFKTPSLYRMVRHPLYLGFVIAFWAAPVMTVGHLLFSMANTLYILIGICFEERDLIRSYGEAYLEYRRRVPMLIPWRARPVERSAERTEGLDQA